MASTVGLRGIQPVSPIRRCLSKQGVERNFVVTGWGRGVDESKLLLDRPVHSDDPYRQARTDLQTRDLNGGQYRSDAVTRKASVLAVQSQAWRHNATVQN